MYYHIIENKHFNGMIMYDMTMKIQFKSFYLLLNIYY